MTFKHTKFEDSPTLRALEKVAKEKGLVKAEALQKKAAFTKKADYTPTDDFMENIFKLCAGLRTAGLEKEASEIEVNYLNYKKAQTLYETSKEKGEDLVQAAHPKGSHKLEGVEGEEATVEDILDQHLKMMQVTEKKPTGKLSTAAILNKVKTVLGQMPPAAQAPKVQLKDMSEAELNNKLDEKLNFLVRELNVAVGAIKQYSGGHAGIQQYADWGLKTATAALTKRPFTRVEYDKLKEALTTIQSTSDMGPYGTSVFNSKEEDDANIANWNNNVAPQLRKSINAIASIEPIIKTIEEIGFDKQRGTYKEPTKTVTSTTRSQFASRISRIFATLDRIEGSPWKSKINPKYHAKVEAAIKGWRSSAEAENKYIGNGVTAGLKDPELEEEKAGIAGRLGTLESEINSFRKDWLKEAI